MAVDWEQSRFELLYETTTASVVATTLTGHCRGIATVAGKAPAQRGKSAFLDAATAATWHWQSQAR